MWEDAFWIKVPEDEIRKWKIIQGDMNGRRAFFRCDFSLEEVGEFVINITANSRYRLWINEQPVMSGPCKGDRFRKYFESVDAAAYLVKGQNVIAVEVLFCDSNSVEGQSDPRASIFAVCTAGNGHRLAVSGKITDKAGNVIEDITTGIAKWKVYLDGTNYLEAGDSWTLNLGALKENIDFREVPYQWKKRECNAEKWVNAEKTISVIQSETEKRVGLYERFPIKEREIPLLYEEKEPLPDFPEKIVVQPGEQKEVILNAVNHTNAYMVYRFYGGKNSEVDIMYSEKYFGKNGKEIKRTDSENGILQGLTDHIILNGEDIIYEPFWFRSFRYIKITINAAETPVTMYRPEMIKTGYPLQIKTKIKSTVPWVEKLWDICIRTLKNCMTETYMDCPYYEQMQFSMDTRLQMLFTYTVSDDTRLARKALEDFHNSILPDGLIQGKYPSTFPQVISTFSLHYIYMLKEFYMQTGELEVLKRYRNDVDRILDYYDRHIGKSGLVEHLGYWEFVDWQKEWEKDMGVPTAALNGPSTIINLMYAYALKYGAEIFEMTGRKGVAEEYRIRRNKIIELLDQLCWDEDKGLYREGPDIYEYTQHAQAWAVINEMVSKKQAKDILEKTLNEGDIIQCSFSTSYELFRALEWAEDYGATGQLMAKWIHLLELECTTCPEEPGNGRSECHAWSALPIYEFIRGIAGIKMENSGWNGAIVNPCLEYVNDIKGTAVTPKGNIEFEFNRAKERYIIKLPDALKNEKV